MSDAPLIVGVSGLRGIVGKSLTPAVATTYAAAFGAWLNEQAGSDDKWPYVLLARDGRAGGEAIYYAAMSALIASGCRVCELGVAMTPTVGVLCDAKKADAAVIITASHNPQEWNGLKFLIRRESWANQTDGRPNVTSSYQPDACAPDAETAKHIVAGFEAGKTAWIDPIDMLSSVSDTDVEDPHCLRVLDACQEILGVTNFWEWMERRPMRVVTDAVNSSARHADRIFFSGTPVHAVHLFSDNSGEFPHTPEPTAENLAGEGGLRDAVPGLKADVGFAQDPDADRLAIIDEQGNYIGEEYTVALAAEAILSARKANKVASASGKPAFVVNLSTSRMIEDVAAAYGAEVIRTPVGEANVVDRMKQLKAEGREVLMGGEGNGGVIWPEVTYVRDSLSGMALVLALMARTGKTLSELVGLINSYSPGGNGYGIEKRKAPIPNKEAAKPAVEAVAKAFASERIDLQDGCRVDFDPDGPRKGVWVHVRASNTEPIMRLICEAPTKELAEQVLAETEAAIAG